MPLGPLEPPRGQSLGPDMSYASEVQERPPPGRRWGLRLEAGPAYRRIYGLSIFGGDLLIAAERRYAFGDLYFAASFSGGAGELGLTVFQICPFVFGVDVRAGPLLLGGGLDLGETVFPTQTGDPTTLTLNR